MARFAFARGGCGAGSCVLGGLRFLVQQRGKRCRGQAIGAPLEEITAAAAGRVHAKVPSDGRLVDDDKLCGVEEPTAERWQAVMGNELP